MPAYNAEKYIESAIISVQNQTFNNWELIIIDDGSDDSTAKIVKSKQERDVRICYKFQTNKKLPAARNAGLMLAKGDYIAFLDADDLWMPEKLEYQLEYFKNNHVDLIFTAGYCLNENTYTLIKYPTIEGSFSGHEMYKLQLKFNYIPVLSVVFKRHWIKIIGYHDESLTDGCEDWDYWFRMAKAGACFVGIKEKLFHYRRHENSMSSNLSRMQLAQVDVFIRNFDKSYFDKREVRELLLELIDPFVQTLLKSKNSKEAHSLHKRLKGKIPLLHYKINGALLSYMGKYSFFPIRIVNKIDRFLNNRKII